MKCKPEGFRIIHFPYSQLVRKYALRSDPSNTRTHTHTHTQESWAAAVDWERRTYTEDVITRRNSVGHLPLPWEILLTKLKFVSTINILRLSQEKHFEKTVSELFVWCDVIQGSIQWDQKKHTHKRAQLFEMFYFKQHNSVPNLSGHQIQMLLRHTSHHVIEMYKGPLRLCREEWAGGLHWLLWARPIHWTRSFILKVPYYEKHVFSGLYIYKLVLLPIPRMRKTSDSCMVSAAHPLVTQRSYRLFRFCSFHYITKRSHFHRPASSARW